LKDGVLLPVAHISYMTWTPLLYKNTSIILQQKH